MTSEAFTALGALLSGIGTVVTTVWYLRAARARADEECDKRLEALREGLRFGREQ